MRQEKGKQLKLLTLISKGKFSSLAPSLRQQLVLVLCFHRVKDTQFSPISAHTFLGLYSNKQQKTVSILKFMQCEVVNQRRVSARYCYCYSLTDRASRQDFNSVSSGKQQTNPQTQSTLSTMSFLVYYTYIARAYGSYNSRGIMGHDPHILSKLNLPLVINFHLILGRSNDV